MQQIYLVFFETPPFRQILEKQSDTFLSLQDYLYAEAKSTFEIDFSSLWIDSSRDGLGRWEGRLNNNRFHGGVRQDIAPKLFLW